MYPILRVNVRDGAIVRNSPGGRNTGNLLLRGEIVPAVEVTYLTNRLGQPEIWYHIRANFMRTITVGNMARQVLIDYDGWISSITVDIIGGNPSVLQPTRYRLPTDTPTRTSMPTTVTWTATLPVPVNTGGGETPTDVPPSTAVPTTAVPPPTVAPPTVAPPPTPCPTAAFEGVEDCGGA